MENQMFKVTDFNEIVTSKESIDERGAIFSGFIKEGDLAIIAGETNVGKSIICADIALANSSNLCYWDEPISDKLRECLYIDGEMSDPQIRQRYGNAPEFALSRIRRASIMPSAIGCTMSDKIHNIKKVIESENIPKLVIVDNLMSLTDCTVSSTCAKKVMESLKQIKEYFDITMIVVAHFRKRNNRRTIEISDIQGSSVIGNYADSIIALGNSCKDTSIKYLKQLKTRSTGISSDVAVLKINDSPYLHFDFLEFDQEENHLKKQASRSSIEDFMAEDIIRLCEAGCSVRTISKELGISKSVIGRFIKNRKSQSTSIFME